MGRLLHVLLAATAIIWGGLVYGTMTGALHATAVDLLKTGGIAAPICAALIYLTDRITAAIKAHTEEMTATHARASEMMTKQILGMDRLLAIVSKGATLAHLHGATERDGLDSTGPFRAYNGSTG